MARRRRTPLTPDDRALWRAAMRGARPLPPDLRNPPEPEAGQHREPPADSPSDHPVKGSARAPDGAAANAPQTPAGPSIRRSVRPGPPPGSPPGPPKVSVDPAPPDLGHDPPGGGIDRRTHLRLKRGQIEPQARIDLHGMSAERAHSALQGFIAQSLARGLRLVLVITGKGGQRLGPGPGAPFMLPPPGLLRRQSPRWLRAGPHGHEIIGMWSAHPRHGGGGAMYVYLKKRR